MSADQSKQNVATKPAEGSTTTEPTEPTSTTEPEQHPETESQEEEEVYSTDSSLAGSDDEEA